MNTTMKFAAAAALALPLVAVLSACSNDQDAQGYQKQQGFSGSGLKSVEYLGEIYGRPTVKIVLDGKKFGRTNDVPCFHYGWAEGSTSCDWDAGGPHITP